MWFYIGIAVLSAIIVAVVIRKKKSGGAVPIKNPVIKIVHFRGDLTSNVLAQSDAKIYSNFYKNVNVIELDGLAALVELVQQRNCQVLHLYADLNDKGKIEDPNGTSADFADFVNTVSEAKIPFLIFAKDIPPTNFGASPDDLTNSPNVVVTLSRKGEAFGNFFKSVFEQVSKGKSMPVAWKNIAPQDPEASHENMPDMLALMSEEQVALIRDKN